MKLSLILLDAGIPHIRNHYVQKYLFDFAFPKEKLLIELDGPYHTQHIPTIERDKKKTLAGTRMGYRIERLENKELRNSQKVLVKIQNWLKEQSSA